ncbi:MAG: Stk1 family PASTA domain-containing Ser/Thr kinase, partial [Micrococcus sp.]|nr:Stk1 family PASTA domain-containing Ser/Thr kinase [Micrococcus sp.]
MPQERILCERYRVQELIGRGGMADVYRGLDERLHRTVAIKMMRPDLARDPQFQSRFRREALSSAALQHPNIVAVFDTGEEDREDRAEHEVACPFLVMEYVEGITLRDRLREDAVDVEDAIAWTRGLLEALAYSHAQGIVHRDIKLANVMVTPAGQVKVMDFGIARALADTSATMTQTQTVVGTAQYLSPEQAKGETVDARSDLYSAGCVAFELLTGRPPFIGDSPVAVAYQHVREQPPAPSALNPDVPAALDAVVLTALAKDREDRFPTADDFIQALDEAQADPDSLPTGALPIITEDLTRRDAHGAVVAGAAAAGAGAASSGAAADLDATQAVHPVSGEATAQLSPASADAAPPTAPTAAVPTAATGSGASPATGQLATVAGGRGTPLSADAAAGQGSSAAVRSEASRSRRRTLLGLLVALAAVLLVVGGVVLASSMLNNNGGPARVTVPEVSGMDEAAAQSSLTSLGLRPITSEVYDDAVPSGVAIGTDPEGGTEVDSGSEVRLQISEGPVAVMIPEDVRGASEATVRDQLSRLGLSVSSVTTVDSDTVQRDRIVGTRPESGTRVAAGSSVELLLSSGRTTVPNLVGMTEQAAMDTLAARLPEVTVRVQRRESNAAAPGRVLTHDPGPEGRIDNTGTVT